PAVPRNPSGAGRYVIELAAALGERDDVEITLLSRRGDEAWWRQLTAATDVAAVAPRSRPARLAWEQMAMARALRRLGPDVHHGPHYTMPERFRGPVVVTIHDLTFFDHPERHEPANVRLRIAGHSGWGRRAVDAAVAASASRDRIDLVGYLPEDDVPPFLQGAAAVAYPSLAEGFGLPALEAMACGAPLVTTTGSAMEEVSAGAALLVSPGDTDALAGALDMIVRGDQGLETRRARGLAVADDQQWDDCARGH